MPSTPLVSIVAPTFNHESYVAKSIQSILDQTFTDFELLITDDGSQDRTVEIIQSFCDPRIQLFCQPVNQGASMASTNSFQHAQGKLIAFLATDDLYHPEKLAKQVQYLQENPQIGAVFTHAHLINDQGQDYLKSQAHFKQPNRTRHEWLHHFFFEGNNLCASSAMVRRECFEKAGYFDKYFAQLDDMQMWIRLCLHYKIHVIQEPLTRLRIRNDNLNASARRHDTRVRTAWEYSRILKNFLTIPSVQELRQIFPELDNLGYSQWDDRLIPFYVAMLALQRNRAGYECFALNTLSDLFEQPDLVALLQEKCGFTSRDWFQLTGQHDVFNIEPARELRLIRSSKSWKRFTRFYRLLSYLLPQEKIKPSLLK